MSAAKKIILLLWLVILASLGNVSALTPGTTETCVWQKSLATVQTRQAEPLETAGRHQENGRAAYDVAPDSLLAAVRTDKYALLSSEYKSAALANVNDGGVTLVGAYNVPTGELNYIGAATTPVKASYFDIGGLWDANPDMGKLANEYFMENRASAGDIFLIHLPDGVEAGKSLQFEMDFIDSIPNEAYDYWIKPILGK